MADLILSDLTAQERRMINILLDHESNYEVSIPEDISDEDLLSNLDLCCRCYKPVDAARTLLIVAIGRMMNMVQKRPVLYKELGYRAFNDWVDAEVIEKHHISHGTVWSAKLILKSFPDLTSQDYAEAKLDNLRLSAKILGDNAPKKQRNELLKKAKQLSVDQFKSFMQESGLMTTGDSNGESLILGGSRNDVRFAKKFFKDEDFQLILETDDPLKMLVRLIEDNMVELRHRATAARAMESEEEVQVIEA